MVVRATGIMVPVVTNGTAPSPVSEVLGGGDRSFVTQTAEITAQPTGFTASRVLQHLGQTGAHQREALKITEKHYLNNKLRLK